MWVRSQEETRAAIARAEEEAAGRERADAVAKEEAVARVKAEAVAKAADARAEAAVAKAGEEAAARARLDVENALLRQQLAALASRSTSA